MPKKPDEDTIATKRYTKAFEKRYWHSKHSRKNRNNEGEDLRKHIVGDLKAADRAHGQGKTGYWNETQLPVHGVFVNALSSAIFNRAPRFSTRLRRHAEDVLRARGQVYVDMLHSVFRESKVPEQIALALSDAFPYRGGCCEVAFDSKRESVKVEWRSMKRVLVDEETDKSPRVQDMRWWGYEFALDRENAQARWPDHDFNAPYDEHAHLEGEYENLPNEPALVEEGAEYTPGLDRTKRVKILYVFVSGYNPQSTKGNKVAKEERDDEGEENREYFKPSDEVIYFECLDKMRLRLIQRKAFDWTLDHDEKPAEFLRLTTDTESFFGSSVLQQWHSLARQAEWAVRYDNTDARLSAQRKVLLAVDMFESKEKAEKVVRSPDNLEVVAVGNAAAAKAGIQILDFGKSSGATGKNADKMMALYMKMSAMDAITMESSTQSRSATDAALMDKRAQVRIGWYADQLERFVQNVARKIIQCALSLLTREQVERIVGYSIAPEVWPEDLDAEYIRREVDIQVEPKSMRFINAEARVQEMMQLHDRQTGTINQAAQMPPMLARTYLRSANSALRAVAEELQIPNYEELLLDPDEVYAALFEAQGGTVADQVEALTGQMQEMQAIMQEMLPPVVPGPGAEGGIPPQAEAAMAGLGGIPPGMVV